MLPAYLVAIGFGTVEIGIVAAASLLGSALLTLGVGMVAPRFELRHLLCAGAVLMAATGVALSGEELWWIVIVCFIGTINASSGDIGLMVPLEHTMLARSAADRERTKVFARYSLIGAMSSAAGALAAAGPDLMVGAGIGKIAAFKLMFCCYGALGLVAAALYRRLRQSRAEERHVSTPLGPSRGMVYKLAALFSLDAFAGGFVVQSLLALWLFEHFGLSLSAASLFFFWTSVLSALSFPLAGWLARHFGLVNTMVFTHIPSSLCLIAAAFAPNLAVVLGLLLVRSALVANGRAHPHLLRHGGGDAGRAGSGGERHRGAAQPCLVAEPGLRRRAVRFGVPGPAAAAVRWPEDRLRRGAAVHLPPRQTARGKPLTMRRDAGGRRMLCIGRPGALS